MRRILYISGTRADFGLMRATLQAIRDDARLEASVVAAGMHLSPEHGLTVDEIEAAGLRLAARVPSPLTPATGATMARAIGAMTTGFVEVMQAEQPDLVLLLGDRGEMLAGAIAALHLNIPVAHIHGGERSGTVDEPVRHAVSKLSHIHLTATDQARERLTRMGEDPARIHVVGAPGLDGLAEAALPDRAEIMSRHGLDPARPFALMVHHPVLQDAGAAGAEAGRLLDALTGAGLQLLALMPNADAGADGVRAVLDDARAAGRATVLTHLARPDFIAVMARADLMAGNSSAGIIEAASFGTPVLNVGPRQTLRERNANVIDVAAEPDALREGVARALANGRFAPANIYGDGRAAGRIVAVLAETPLDDALMRKVNGY